MLNSYPISLLPFFLIPFSFAFYIDADPSAVEKKSSILTLLVLLFILFLKSNKDNLPGLSLLDQMPNNLIYLRCHQGNISKA